MSDQPTAQPVTYRLEDLDVQEVSVVDRGANKRTFLVVKRDEEKAEWSTAFVNDLPDSAFLHIKPDGKKDDEGKTVPRSLRMFPVRDQNGKIDLPHLRNAIARIPVAGISADLKDKLQAQARRMLEEQKEANMPTNTEDDFEKAIADAQSGEANPSDDIENTTDAGEPIEQAEPSDDPVVEAQADKADEETHLAVEMNADVRAKVGDILAKMSDRMKALSEAVLAARDGEGDLPMKMKSEIDDVMQTLSSVVQADEQPAQEAPEAEKAEDEEEDAEKGPLAEPGNPPAKTPNEMGRPMAMRYAMKMAGMAKDYLEKAHGYLMGPSEDGDEDDAEKMEEMLSEKSMDEKRRAHMEAMMKGASCMAKAMRAIGPFIPDEGGAPMQEEMTAAYAYNPPQASQPAGVPSAQLPGANLKKAGRKISAARLDKLEAMHAQLATLLGELRGASEVTEKVTKDNAAKEAEVARLAAQVRQLTEIAKSQHAELHSLKSSRPDSNASAAGDFAQVTTPFSWPDDMNDQLDSDLQF